MVPCPLAETQQQMLGLSVAQQDGQIPAPLDLLAHAILCEAAILKDPLPFVKCLSHLAKSTCTLY